jgi:hypothetical protein
LTTSDAKSLFSFIDRQQRIVSHSSSHLIMMSFTQLLMMAVAVPSARAFVLSAPRSFATPTALRLERRDVFQTVVAVTAAAAMIPPPAFAAVGGTQKVNAKLTSFGLPPLSNLPDGFTPLLEIYGKGKNRAPLLITFNHPISWVVTLPSNTVNGEDGTIQVGDYGKGDTATLFVTNDVEAKSLSKEVIEQGIRRSISQRGDNMYQNFKLTKVLDGPGPYLDGQSYMIADFKYQLITGAGFEVDRKGVAAITLQGASPNGSKTLEIFWAASTDARFKKTESTLRDIVTSFRCYADGLNFAEELVA